MKTSRLFRAVSVGLCLAASLQAYAADYTLYADLGGSAGIRRVVADLLPVLQADARISASFDGVDFVNLAARLEEQFCDVSGGPCKYGGKDMHTIHEDLKVNRAQFNAMVEDLQAAMRKNDVPPHTQNRLLARLATMHREIVTR